MTNQISKMSVAQSTPTHMSPEERLQTMMDTQSFHGAIRFNYLQSASGYLNIGVDINSLYAYPSRTFENSQHSILRYRVTALFYVAERGILRAVEFLLDFGADVRVRNVVSFFDAGGSRREMEEMEGLSALDGMRMSKSTGVRELVARRYGPESVEDRERREEVLERMKEIGRRRTVGVETRSRIKRVGLS
ncbi:hypothetical protein BDV96DRAFT_591123 [Lophiotrema nucula]|uniref:Uncharacterized protein n=1 Tax=Lophiotrema nucula TaxID=690887 RepID=A0A6A5YH79_9PLEO|nr:hypothetical protein BDV96DRAFT_591123 [Lophiotrema nucula]